MSEMKNDEDLRVMRRQAELEGQFAESSTELAGAGPVPGVGEGGPGGGGAAGPHAGAPASPETIQVTNVALVRKMGTANQAFERDKDK